MHKYLFNYRVSFYITSKLNLLIRKKKNIWKRTIHILVFVLSCLYTLENISEKGEKRDFIKRNVTMIITQYYSCFHSKNILRRVYKS